MRRFPDTTLVIPCFDEADRLDVEAFRAALDERQWLRLLFVDDGSTDETGAILQRLADESDRVEVLTLERNVGKAEAVRRGMLEARRRQDRLFGYWDADLSTPLDAVDRLASELESRRALLAMGSRVKLLGRTIERKPDRHYLGRVFATAASLVLELPVYDTQCGAKLFHRDAPLGEIFGEPFHTRWIFDVEMLGRFLAATAGASDRIVEVPLERWVDVAGSKLTAGDFARAAIDLTAVARALRRRRRQ